jgi:hypothetical protein
MSASAKPRGKPRKYPTAEASKSAKLRYLREYNDTQKAKESRKRYTDRLTKQRQKKAILKKFSENDTFCKETLKEALKNEQIRNIIKELMQTNPE